MMMISTVLLILGVVATSVGEDCDHTLEVHDPFDCSADMEEFDRYHCGSRDGGCLWSLRGMIECGLRGLEAEMLSMNFSGTYVGTSSMDNGALIDLQNNVTEMCDQMEDLTLLFQEFKEDMQENCYGSSPDLAILGKRLQCLELGGKYCPQLNRCLMTKPEMAFNFSQVMECCSSSGANVPSYLVYPKMLKNCSTLCLEEGGHYIFGDVDSCETIIFHSMDQDVSLLPICELDLAGSPGLNVLCEFTLE